ncbi:hypothetical protein MRB53_040843 [Persea americana]|nr:hypothetical protein MRB53_040843 [Persea americana]
MHPKGKKADQQKLQAGFCLCILSKQVCQRCDASLRILDAKGQDESLRFKEARKLDSDEMPQSLNDFRISPTYILEKQLRRRSSSTRCTECV